MSPITPCLWFDGQAEEAANYYVSIFDRSRITQVTRHSGAGQEVHRRPAGSVLMVAFELDGRPFTALNGGPEFQFNEAISFQVLCDTQQQVDRYWDRLGDGGELVQCGWLKDRYGVSWQIVPQALIRLLNDPDPGKSQRAMQAMLTMKKLDIRALERACEES